MNSDQTQAIYEPGDKMMWSGTGLKQVIVVRAEKKWERQNDLDLPKVP